MTAEVTALEILYCIVCQELSPHKLIEYTVNARYECMVCGRVSEPRGIG